MKQFVNLYTEQLRPKKEVLPLQQVIVLGAVSLVLMVAVIGGLSWQKSQLLAEEDAIKQEQTKVKEQVAALSQALAARRADDSVQKLLESAQGQRDSYQQLLRRLRQEQNSKSGVFADFMQSFAEIDTANVWLSQIQLIGLELNITGYMASERALSEWLARFKQQPNLKGRRFSQIQVERQQNKSWQFQLTATKGN